MSPSPESSQEFARKLQIKNRLRNLIRDPDFRDSHFQELEIIVSLIDTDSTRDFPEDDTTDLAPQLEAFLDQLGPTKSPLIRSFSYLLIAILEPVRYKKHFYESIRSWPNVDPSQRDAVVPLIEDVLRLYHITARIADVYRGTASFEEFLVCAEENGDLDWNSAAQVDEEDRKSQESAEKEAEIQNLRGLRRAQELKWERNGSIDADVGKGADTNNGDGQGNPEASNHETVDNATSK